MGPPISRVGRGGRGEADRLGALAHGEGLLDLGRRVVVGVAGLVGVERAVAGRSEGDHAAARWSRCAEVDESTVMVTARPEVAVAVGV